MSSTPKSRESTEFLARLSAALERFALRKPVPRYAVALSGGKDSMVLLAAMVRLAGAAKVAAFHVDHGLNPESSRWAALCASAARALGTEFQSARVTVPVGSEHGGIEAAAREVFFGGTMAALVLSFGPPGWIRAAQPVLYAGLALLLATTFGLVPGWFFT